MNDNEDSRAQVGCVLSQCPAPGEHIYKDNSGPGLGKLLPGVGVPYPYVRMSSVHISECQDVWSGVLMSGCHDVRCPYVMMSGCLVSICQDIRMSSVHMSGCLMSNGCKDVWCPYVRMSGCLVSICQDVLCPHVRLSGVHLSGCQDV